MGCPVTYQPVTVEEFVDGARATGRGLLRVRRSHGGIGRLGRRECQGGAPVNAPKPAGGEALRTVTLVVAAMTTGFTASVFVHWSKTIVPGLGEVDDRAFVASFHALDAAITIPLFLGVGFLGALLSTGLAASLHLHPEQRRILIWIAAALVCYLAALVITFGVHEPLNQTLTTPGERATDADFAAARAGLDEARWTAWNTVRAITSTVAFGCLTWAVAGSRRWRSTAL